MKEIIVNSSKDNRIITLVENGKLVEKYEEYDELKRLEGNIYLGIVKDVLPGMQAAFVDIGDDKNAFLHIKDLLPKKSNETGNKNEDFSRYNIKDYVQVGMPILVQVKKDKTDKKGAKISTSLNIAGKFVALVPDSEFITISQKIEDSEQIDRLISTVKDLNIHNYGIIIRTSAINANESQMQEDLYNVITKYSEIKTAANTLISRNITTPTLLLEKGSILKTMLIDIANQGLNNVYINNKDEYFRILEFAKNNDFMVNVHFIEKDNILDMYDLQKQIDKTYNRKIWLKCGGFIIIDKTEALTAIDVNSGKFTGKECIEKTVFKVNSEATIEIANQLRLRDIGGIVVIDYIDMDNKQDEEAIQKLLIENLKKDRAKTQVVGFTKLHLLEMTRKHICG